MPVPPEVTAVHVAVAPAEMEVGETEQEAVRTGTTVIGAVAILEPFAFVQVSL